MKKLITILSALGLLSLACACSPTAINQNIVTTTQNLVALNNALITVNATILNNVQAQAKVMAPYVCGTAALATTIINNSTAEASVNKLLSTSLAANITVVAVQDLCSAAGLPTTVSATSGTPASN